MNTPGAIPAFSQRVDETIALNNWIFNNTQSYIEPRIMVVGRELSAFSSLLIEQNFPIHLCDPDGKGREMLLEKYKGNNAVRAIHEIDFLDPDFDRNYSQALGAFTTVLFLNTLEHSFYNQVSLKNTALLLHQGGNLIIAMPAFTATYEGLQLTLQDWKRLDYKPLTEFFVGWEILKVRYFYLEDTGFYAVVIASKHHQVINTF